ncbi:hypothetical protein LPTSP4_32540 [Leptospira ryugenii]|uniref:Polyhydroxybutyrate depolymerase n=1 Tax=Leptospira ryugenii TaxID=1917863 RepID=A0A2P2E4D5_9LEPT|nr:hypothetical protein [Leptospira ryugenii]GBF51716.1 hypothetical protein LPTSP4_32540 [Leptospira ryugenii]
MQSLPRRKIIWLICSTILFIAIGVAFSIFRWNVFNPLKKEQIEIDGILREFYYHVPNKLKDHPKLIFVLHGSAMTAGQMQLVTGHLFDQNSDLHQDSIIIYPQGYQKYWNDCRASAKTKAKLQNINELEFFQAMISFFKSKYSVSNSFLVGFSNGGHMVFRFALEAPELFSAFAVIAANLPVPENNECKESKKPVSLLLINGTADPVNPFNGGKVVVHDGIDRGIVHSTWETILYWRNLTDCKQDSEGEYPDIEVSDQSSAKIHSFLCKRSKEKIRLIEVINGGHNIPNPTFFFWPKKQVGNVNEDLNVPEIIYDYFREWK